MYVVKHWYVYFYETFKILILHSSIYIIFYGDRDCTYLTFLQLLEFPIWYSAQITKDESSFEEMCKAYAQRREILCVYFSLKQEVRP